MDVCRWSKYLNNLMLFLNIYFGAIEVKQYNRIYISGAYGKLKLIFGLYNCAEP